eukprot:Gb_39226 [translate_table: standard]
MRRGKHSRVICEVGSDLSRVQTANVAHLDGTSQLKISRRQTALSLGSITLLSLTLPLVAFPAFGLLEADDDEELLEKVKEDRKKRLQKSEQTNTLKNETEGQKFVRVSSLGWIPIVFHLTFRPHCCENLVLHNKHQP